MEGTIYIILFMICIIISLVVSFILYKYQYTVSPINQNIIQKLSTFCVLMMTPGVCIQVQTLQNLFKCLSICKFQGVSVILKAAFGSLGFKMALLLRTFLFFTVLLVFSIGNIICFLRLIFVLQVSALSNESNVCFNLIRTFSLREFKVQIHIYFASK